MGDVMKYTNILFVSMCLLASNMVYAADTTNTTSDSYDEVIDSEEEVYDPIEPVNRGIYEFNRWADKLVVRPIAKGYQIIIPKPVRKSVRNALCNLQEPITILNASFQGDANYAFTSFGRFALNSTFGIGGLFQVVDANQKRTEDFGQTLGHYGTNPGPYLMLPILGPSNIRDGVGRVADLFSDPSFYILSDDALLVKAGITGIDMRESLLDVTDEVDRTSFDPYATYRSMYTQYRKNLIQNGKDDRF